MGLVAITVFAIGAVLYSLIASVQWRGWALLLGSVVAVYWLQPPLTILPLAFVLPTATIGIGILGWFVTRQESTLTSDDKLTLGLVIALVMGLCITGGLLRITPSQPPSFIDVALILIGFGAVTVTLAGVAQDRQRAIPVFIVLILIVFVVLKSDPLTLAFSQWARSQTGRPISLAGVGDLQWLGFSYLSFRLIHTLRDRQSGRLPALSLREYLTYLIFFPAYTAGPIDRAERFVKDFRLLPRTDAARTVEALSRIVIGLFKKFVIADGLALFALNATKATEAQTSGGMWLLLYAYAFRIFFDFSGYSDIAIGLGRLYGINLPENFDRPYLKDSITTFWQSWHMTLSNWARAYVFTPLSRALMNRPTKPSPTVVVFVTQVTTMVAIGLWHGVSINFVIWGIWHGVGLFVHKLYTDRTRVFYQNLNEKPRLRRAANWLSIILTFHFVALGWVWFALPDPAASLNVLRRLFGG